MSFDHFQGFDCIFSECRRYRYTWTAPRWSDKPYAQFIGLNPSTADESASDPTIRRCLRFARDWGYGGLVMTNLFAWRATQPADMKASDHPVGPENDHWLQQIARDAGIVVAAWGTHGAHLGRDIAVRRLLPSLSQLRLSKDGHPWHPLYLPASLLPQPWSLPA